MEGGRWLPWLAILPRPAGEQLTMLLMSTERGRSHQGSQACGHLGCSGGVLLFPLQALPHQEPNSWAQPPDIVDRAGVPGDDPRKNLLLHLCHEASNGLREPVLFSDGAFGILPWLCPWKSGTSRPEATWLVPLLCPWGLRAPTGFFGSLLNGSRRRLIPLTLSRIKVNIHRAKAALISLRMISKTVLLVKE